MNKLDLNNPEIKEIVELALREDHVDNDITAKSALFDRQNPTLIKIKKVRATIIAKKPTIACGSDLIELILKTAKCENVKVSKMFQDGTELKANSPWIILEGPAYDVLRTERVILNFLMRMSGIATHTKKIVNVISATECKLLHTRKTLPGHRALDIYATLVGGAHPHRKHLADAILIKENHISAAESYQQVFEGIQHYRSNVSFVEIEVRDFTELKYAIGSAPNRIMLDNFSVEDVQKVMNLFGSHANVEFEASGGIAIENAKNYAETGVHFISTGAITHTVAAADLSMLFDYENH